MSLELDRMRREWESLGIQHHFKKVHHFSSDKFRSKPSGLDSFCDWCKDREIEDENLQTLNTALTVSSLIQQGKSPEFAIERAWEAYPIVKR